MTASHTTHNKIIGSDPNFNIWISASAGSGKTKILVDRFLRLLLLGADPTKILCITFTKSAASEMITRIISELGTWALCSDEELDVKLFSLTNSKNNKEFARTLFAKLVDNQPNLKIQTIHSFCQNLLKKFSFSTLVSKDFIILDEYERKKLILDTKTKLFNELSDEHILEGVSEYAIDELINEILVLNNFEYDFLYDRQKALEYIEALKNAMGVKDYDLAVLFKNFLQEFSFTIKSNNDLLRDSVPIIQFIKSYVLLNNEEQFNNLDQLKEIFLTKENKPRAIIISKQKASNEEIEVLKTLQDIVVGYTESALSIQLLDSTKKFIDFSNSLNEVFIKTKRDHNSVDYGDLINLSIDLLKIEEIRYRISYEIEHILIDESQDINIKQWRIIHSLVNDLFVSDNNKTLFVVGDSKQSIYSFQGASPDIFQGARQLIANLVESSGKNLKNIELRQSYRSHIKILEFVDIVFGSMGFGYKHFSEITEEVSIEIWPLIIQAPHLEEASAWKVKTEYNIILDPQKDLAEKISSKVKSLLDSGLLRPKDIMILLRTRNDLFDYLVESFKSKSIPSNGMDRLIFKDSLAIKDFLSIAKFILLPEDDYNLACLIKSPTLGLSEDDLFRACTRKEGDSIWYNINKSQDENLNEACRFLNAILSAKKNIQTPFSLFSYVLNVLEVRKKFIARFGLYIDDVINQFLDIALQFESTDLSISNFVYFCENLDLEVKINLDMQNDEVKIMTVHASKGLQSKLVILPDTLSLPHNSSPILFDPEKGIILYKGSTKHVNSFYQSINESIKDQAMQEYYRLLYVALTRASNHLIICGAGNSEKIAENCWYSLLSKCKVA